MQERIHNLTSHFSRSACALVFALLTFAFPAAILASDEQVTAEEKFKPGDMIIHHISDAHQIHLIGHLYIPLPVILLHDGHLDVFSSANFWDGFNDKGELKFKPYTAGSGVRYENHHEQIIVAADNDNGHHGSAEESGALVTAPSDTLHMADSLAQESHVAEQVNVHENPGEGSHEEHSSPLDFSITKTVFGMLLVIVLMVVIFRGVAKSYDKRKGQAPRGLQNLLEPFILFVREDVAIPSIGKHKADRYVPFLLTVFFFIWICNLLGLIPFIGGFNITGTLSVTLVLAGLVFLITTFSGNRHYWGHILWPPGVPLPIKFILVPIEIMSVFIKPAVLMIRLTANITAGHIIILAFVGLVLLFGQNSPAAGYGVGVGAVLFMVFMFFIELLVAFLQAYVFTLLAALYFGDATQEHHHDNSHESH